MEARWWSRLTAVLTLAAAWRLLAPTVADPDLWGHILFGQRTLSLGLEREDPFSYLSGDHGWINHEWLSEVAFGAAFDAAGAIALIALKVTVALLTVGLVYGHVVRRGADPLRAGLVLLPSILLMTPGFATVRPQMFTFLFFALTVIVVHRIETRSERWLVALPPLLAVWVNFHGGVLAGAGILGIWGIARVADAWFAPDRRAALRGLRGPIAAGLACGLALVANPYGPGLPAFLLRTATVPRPDIVEWQGLDVFSVPGVIWLGLTAFAAATILRSAAPKRPALLAVLLALVLLPLSAVRHLQLFAIGLPVVLADDFVSAWRRRTPPSEAGPRGRFAVVSATLIAASLLVAMGTREATCIRIDRQRSIAFPVRAVDWLARSGVSGNMATYFDWGEYAIWHLYPDVLVGMDGRRETVYPPDIYREYLRFQSGVEGWSEVIERPETDMVLFSRAWPTYSLMSLAPGWTRAYEDEIAGVFVREGHPAAVALAFTPPADLPASGHGLCVP